VNATDRGEGGDVIDLQDIETDLARYDWVWRAGTGFSIRERGRIIGHAYATEEEAEARLEALDAEDD
jgi:hypothetical protein